MSEAQMNEIAKQARQGSMAAIIQILNEQLADQGVRTRAVMEEGILQVLCEASHSESLDQSLLVSRIREILEGIEPRHLRRVNICSRIAQEQQLVWFTEVHRNPESQLLWSEVITLRRPNLFQRLGRKGQKPKGRDPKTLPLPSFSSPKPKTSLPWRGLLMIFGLCGVSFGAGLLYNTWRSQFSVGNPFLAIIQPVSSVTDTSTPVQSTTPEATSSSPPTPAPTTVLVSPPNTPPTVAPSPDPFAEAVRLAEQVSTQGQTASTATEWLRLAAQWQKASDLMKSVPAEDPRYKMAQDRMTTYQNNSQVAQQQAKVRNIP